MIHTYAIPLVYFAMQIHRLLYLTLFYSVCVHVYIYIYTHFTLSYIYSHTIWLLTTGMSTCAYSPYHMIAVHSSRRLEKPIQIHDIILHMTIYIYIHIYKDMYVLYFMVFEDNEYQMVSIYQLFWCPPGEQGLTHSLLHIVYITNIYDIPHMCIDR